jgi:hypothetical protein
MKFFIIKLVDGDNRGAYRIMANTQETAEQRAQVSFKNEFGAEGKVDYVEEVGKKESVVLSACCGVPAVLESAAEGYSCPKCGSSDSDE